MADAIGNPAGFVPIFDGGNPRIIPGAANTVISGGCLVTASGVTGVVSSGTNSFVTADVKFVTNASGTQFTGIALADTASGSTLGVATRVAALVLADGAVTAGTVVGVAGVNAVRTIPVGSTVVGNVPIGRALTTATSGTYCLIDFGRA
tara:strand:+ start:2859 stop:3305 length:447 start_codon:yes stop_codon:yes gene_type:complete